MSTGKLMSAGIGSAIAASLCCIAPVVAIFAGSSSLAASFSWLGPARPYLIGLSIIVLAFAWYQQLRPVKTSPMDCNCKATKGSSFLQSKGFLGIITLFAILMMTFPLYANIFYPKPQGQATAITAVEDKQQAKFTIQGMTCKGCEDHVNNELSKVMGVITYTTSYAAKSSVVTFDFSKVDMKVIAAAISKTGYKVKNYELMDATNAAISFYKAPLVCHAAPSIGCGSKAKFLLVDLEKNKEAVESAWLNRKGTVVAVKWAINIDEKQKPDLIKTVSAGHNIELIALTTTEAADHARTFPDNKNWFKGKEVDKLSKEEATIIAQNTIEGYKKDDLVQASFEKQFQADIEKIYADLFLSISSYLDLTTEAYNKVEKQIKKAGEKYVGKGKMPRVELCVAGESCEQDKSCSEGEKSCCKKN